jgi:hypothetical protein
MGGRMATKRVYQHCNKSVIKTISKDKKDVDNYPEWFLPLSSPFDRLRYLQLGARTKTASVAAE